MLDRRTMLAIAQNKLVRESLAAQPEPEVEDAETGGEEEVLCCVLGRVEVQAACGADRVHAGFVFVLQAANADVRVDRIGDFVEVDPVP